MNALEFRLAFREGRQRPMAAIAAVGLVALPLAASIWATSFIQSREPTGREELQWRFGTAFSLVTTEVEPPLGVTPPDAPFRASAAVRVRTGAVGLRVGDGPTVNATVSDRPIDTEMFRPTVHRTNGPSPGPGEIAVSRALLGALDADIGDEVRATGLTEPRRIVGTADEASDFDALTAFVAPGSPDPALLRSTYYVADRVLDQPGWLVEQPFHAADLDASGADQALVLVVSGLAILVAAVVLNSVLSIGAGQQLRTLGLLGAAGATPRQLRRLVGARATIVSLAVAAVGVPVGLTAVWATTPFIEDIAGAAVGGMTIRSVDVGVLVVMSLTAGLGSTVISSTITAAIPTLTALAGRRPPGGRQRIGTLSGLTLLLLGAAAIAATAVADSTSVLGIWVGVGLALLGFALLSTAVVGLAGQVAAIGSGTIRLGMRTAARHRARSAGVTCAVVAICAVAMAGATLLAEERRTAEAASTSAGIGPDKAVVSTWMPNQNLSLAADRVAAVIGDAVAADLRRANTASVRVPGGRVAVRLTASDTALLPDGASFPLVDAPKLLTVLGAPTRAEAALARVDAVVFHAGDEERIGEAVLGGEETIVPVTVVWVPTTRPDLIGVAVVSEAAVGRITGARVETQGRMYRSPGALDADQRRALTELGASLSSTGIADVYIRPDVEDRRTDEVLVAIAAALCSALAVALGLALFQAESRQERAVLVAVGSGPRHLRRLLLVHGMVVTVAALLLAIPAGHGAIKLARFVAIDYKGDPLPQPPFPTVAAGALVAATLVAAVLALVTVAWRGSKTAVLPSLLAGD